MRRLGVFLCLYLWISCGEQSPLPKPRAYPRVEFPQKTYQQFIDQSCPFTFQYPVYAELEQRDYFFGEKPAHPCWFNLYFKQFKARLHLSYLPVQSRADYDKYVTDSYRIASKINQRSNYMDDVRVANASGVHGIIMEFSGPAASPMHFFLTDTTSHFFRGALYFNAPPRPDSIAPIAEFLKADIADIVNSFRWQGDE